MKKATCVGLAASVAACLFIAWFSRDPVIAQEKPARAAQKWEYKVVQMTSGVLTANGEADFNKLGADGWELSGTVSWPDIADVFGSSFVFKRPKR